MLTKLINRFFIPNTVAGVMNVFQKTISDLEAVAEHHKLQAEKHEEKIENYLAKVDYSCTLIEDHEAEIEKAQRMVRKLNILLGFDI